MNNGYLAKTLLTSIITQHPDTVSHETINLKGRDFQLFEQFMDCNTSHENKDLIIIELKRRDVLLLNELFHNNVSSFIDHQTESVKNNIYYLINNININFPEKIQLIEILVLYDKKISRESVFQKTYNVMFNLLHDVSLYDTIQQKTFNVSTTLLFYTIKELLKQEYVRQMFEEDTNILLSVIGTLKNTLISTITNIFTNSCWNEDFKYKLFDSIKKDDSILINIKHMIANLIFLFQFKNYKYNLFLCQYLLNEHIIEDKHIERLYSIATSTDEEYCKSDIADFLLSVDIPGTSVDIPGTSVNKYKRMGVELFSTTTWDSQTKSKIIYNNKQNVHSVDLNKYIKPFFEKLINIDFLLIIPSNNDEDHIHKTIQEIINKCETVITAYNLPYNIDTIKRTIQRFILDNTLYTDKYVSLLQLLFRCYFYIKITLGEMSSEELFKRFVEELYEMADTCSSGHLVRLANIFSGFDNTTVIDVQDELRACIFTRLTKIINSKPDELSEQIYDNVQSEMFMKLLSQDLVVLYNQLLIEYVDSGIISNSNYQESFRKYLTMFQTGETV